MSKIEVRLNPDVTPAGSDLSIVNAARRSFNKRSEWEWSCVRGCEGPNIPCTKECHRVNKEAGNYKLKDSDKRLLHFLVRGMTADDLEEFKIDVTGDAVLFNEEPNLDKYLVEKLWQWRNTPTHDTPFNHTFMSFEVKAPIFVARQLAKHEYLIMSEFSRRYITDDIEFYEPDYWRKAAPNKKQGSLEEPVEQPLYKRIHGTKTTQEAVVHMQELQVDLFEDLIEQGVAPEQARMVLPQSTMTEWTWSGTLGAFAKMVRERLHPDAQYETRIVAQWVYDLLKDYYPVAAPALIEGPDV